MLACYEWAWKYRNDTIVFSFLRSESTKKSLIVCSRDFVCTIKTGVETSRWILTIVPASQASECYRFSADLWPGFCWNVASIRMTACIALTQTECNLPAFIQAILRIVFHAFFTGGSDSSKEEICPDIILYLSPSGFSLEKTSCHGANSIVVSSDTAHENNCRSWRTVARKKFSGRNSRANKALGIVRNGKGLFLWRPRPKTRSAKDFPRGIRRLRWNAPRDNRVDSKTVCCLINVQPFIRVVTEGHLSGFLNYLVRKFLFLRWEFCSEWKEGAFETLFGETSDATRSSHFRWPTFYFKSFVSFAIQEVRSINIILFSRNLPTNIANSLCYDYRVVTQYCSVLSRTAKGWIHPLAVKKGWRKEQARGIVFFNQPQLASERLPVFPTNVLAFVYNPNGLRIQLGIVSTIFN